jgi:hypothetical protein
MKLQNLIHILIGIVCIGLLPKAQAVVPAPDGGYPNGTTAEGSNALFSLTSGVWNTALGFEALNHDTIGKDNTATGLRALFNNTSGSNNSANGVYALYSNINGWYNNAVGAYALANNISGDYNTATGYAALYRNTGDANTADGFAALYSNTTGAANVAVGLLALNRNTEGAGNTAIGFGALSNNTIGQFNIALGRSAGFSVSTADNVICIGSNVVGANVSNSCFIGNIRGVTTANGDAIPVLIDSAGQLGTASSSRRFKSEIKAMDRASEAILALKPVTFHYKSDNTGTPQFGLIAEEVAAVNPDLVVRDEKGEIYTVRYDAVNAMLLNEFLKPHNEFLKEHRTVREQEKEIDALKAELKEQRALIQKVNDKMELNRPAPQTVVNNQ